jgi:phosphoserine phosphatase
VAKQVVAEQKLNVDWRNSIAVGDTETDIPLLGMVGKPIAFNPNFSLARVAKRRGWTIVVERKDVIYQLHKFNFNNHA